MCFLIDRFFAVRALSLNLPPSSFTFFRLVVFFCLCLDLWAISIYQLYHETVEQIYIRKRQDTCTHPHRHRGTQPQLQGRRTLCMFNHLFCGGEGGSTSCVLMGTSPVHPVPSPTPEREKKNNLLSANRQTPSRASRYRTEKRVGSERVKEKDGQVRLSVSGTPLANHDPPPSAHPHTHMRHEQCHRRTKRTAKSAKASPTVVVSLSLSLIVARDRAVWCACARVSTSVFSSDEGSVFDSALLV